VSWIDLVHKCIVTKIRTPPMPVLAVLLDQRPVGQCRGFRVKGKVL
jgi:hypothetical protein